MQKQARAVEFRGVLTGSIVATTVFLMETLHRHAGVVGAVLAIPFGIAIGFTLGVGALALMAAAPHIAKAGENREPHHRN